MRKTLLLLTLFLFPLSVFGQVSVNVSTTDPVYRDIDKLIGHGLIDKVIIGQRPYSRKEIGRLIAEAKKNLPRIEKELQKENLSEKKKNSLEERVTYIQKILSRLEKDYEEELILIGAKEGEKNRYSIHPLEKAEINSNFLFSPVRPINPNNGIGGIDAFSNPLVQNREGRHIIDGTNLSLETSHWARLSNHFALYAKPRFQLARTRDGTAGDSNAYVQNLYGKFQIKNVEVEIGRDNLLWGQGEKGGLLLSNNPRGLDLIKLSNDSPFFLPWVFKYLGPNKFSFFYSDLGPEQNFPNPYLVGYKWSLQPTNFFELGLSIVSHGGGKGSPPASFAHRVKDIFNGNSTVQISNKLGGIDFRFRVPQARGLQIYGEMIFDDNYYDPDLLHAQFIDDAGYIFGLYVPRITNSGKVDLRLEYHQTGHRYYRHGQFISGWTLNQRTLGIPLGPDSQGLYVTLNWDITDHDLFTGRGGFERRSSDNWEILTNPKWNFVKTGDSAEEKSYQIGTEWIHRFEEFPLLIKTSFAYERVQNAGFTTGVNRNNFLGELFFQFNLDQLTKIKR